MVLTRFLWLVLCAASILAPLSKGVAQERDSLGVELSPSGTLVLSEGSSKTLSINLVRAPEGGNATVRLSSTHPDIAFYPKSLVFTAQNHAIAQRVDVAAFDDGYKDGYRDDDDDDDDCRDDYREDDDDDYREGYRDDDDDCRDDDRDDGRADRNSYDRESATIIFTIQEGNIVSKVMQRVLLLDDDNDDDDYAEHIRLYPSKRLRLAEGSSRTISVGLGGRPDIGGDVTISISSSNPDVILDRRSLTFTLQAYQAYTSRQLVRVFAAHDDDDHDDLAIIEFSDARGRFETRLRIVVSDDDGDSAPPWRTKASALALPPSDSSDSATLRLRCRAGDRPCEIHLECSAQDDGSVFEGYLPQAIPAGKTKTLTMKEVEESIGASWSGKGRLGCVFRSQEDIGLQVWTRSGGGVLVNNSAFIRSVSTGGEYRADIESIPSPDAFDESNIRLRCGSSEGDCIDLRFECYCDDGVKYEGRFGDIPQGATRHLQSSALADLIGYRWSQQSLACEIYAKREFTVQALTRTGTNALVNNSATGSASPK
ncbi:MAG: hypothetical protein ISN28_12990 [Ectothiorhodospiraceae bacterium AqS1]|nr:hypothetical protein [Ectothiorhodospiraceae bacterium AqS1]